MGNRQPHQGAFLSDSATIKRCLPEKDLFYENKNALSVVLLLSLPAISAEHSEMKMSDMSSSASSQEYMSGMKSMHDKMMAAVNESDPDKVLKKA